MYFSGTTLQIYNLRRTKARGERFFFVKPPQSAPLTIIYIIMYISVPNRTQRDTHAPTLPAGTARQKASVPSRR